MVKTTNSIRVNFKEIHGCLCSLGKYESAEVKFVKGEYITDKPLKTIKQPEFKHATRTILMNSDFVEMCLTKPPKPHRNASLSEWGIYNEWNKISDRLKIKHQLLKIANDLQSELISFEIV